MHQYVYDTFLSDKRYAKPLAELENRLTDLGIHGRIDRLHPFKSLREAVEEGVKRGTRTLVAVGSDETFKKVLDVVAGRPITMGFIPFVGPSAFAELLGIPEGVAACDVLSARLTEMLDIGKVNGQYFLAGVSFGGRDVTLECEGKYQLALVHGGRVSICNAAPVATAAGASPANPFDGYLETVLEPDLRGVFRSRARQSVLPLKRIVVRGNGPFSLVADGRESTQSTAEIEVAKEKLRLIIGKARAFAGTPA